MSGITYTTGAGIISTLNGPQARSFCSGGVITLSTLDVTPGTNTFEIDYGTNTLATTILRLLLGFLALGLLAFSIVGIKSSYEEGKFDLNQFFIYCVELLIATVLIIVLMNIVVDAL